MRKAIVSLVSGNIISKLLGLIREIIVAALFGTGYINGAYRVAQTGTLVPVNFFISDSLTAFIPLYKVFFSESPEKAKLFFWAMQILFFLFSILLISCGIVLVKQWLMLIAPGLDKETAVLAENMLIVMSFGIPLYLASALINYVEMAHDDFFPMSLRPSIQNIGMLLGAVMSFFMHNPIYLAWGFTISYLFFFIWVFSRGLKHNVLTLPTVFDSDTLKSVCSSFWRTLRPLIFLPILNQGSLAVERAVATLISITAISALDYAKFITETLILVVSAPIALVGLANWGGMNAGDIREKLIGGVQVLLIFSLPISLFLYMNAEYIVTVLFHRGSFDHTSIVVTANILKSMSVGIWANVIGYVLIKALNAQLKNIHVMFIMGISLSANMCINYLFYSSLKESVLGLSYTINSFLVLILCLYFLNIYKEVFKMFIYILAGAIAYYYISTEVPKLSNTVFISLLLNGGFFCFFWSCFFFMVKPILNLLKETIRR